MFQVRVLGEYGPYPAPGGATTGYLIQTDAGNVLLDCGSGVFAELTKHVQLTELDAVILTHHHADHVSDIPVMRYAVMVGFNQKQLTRSLPIYANKDPHDLFQALAFENYVKPIEVTHGSKLELIGATFTFAKTVHAISCLAVSVEYQGKKFTFSADSGPCEELELIAKGSDLFICEASWLEKDRGPAEIGHLTTKEAAQIAKRAEVKQLVLTHFYPGYDLQEIKREAESEFGREIGLCRQGEVWTI